MMIYDKGFIQIKCHLEKKKQISPHWQNLPHVGNPYYIWTFVSFIVY